MINIIDVGNKMALYENEKRISPIVNRISYSNGVFYLQDHLKINYFRKEQDVSISFCISSKGYMKGPIYNSYFNNADYVCDLAYYDRYLNNLKNRIYFHCMHEYFNKDKSVKRRIK